MKAASDFVNVTITVAFGSRKPWTIEVTGDKALPVYAIDEGNDVTRDVQRFYLLAIVREKLQTLADEERRRLYLAQ